MTTLSELEGTSWIGSNELWLDPLGDQVLKSDGTIEIRPREVRYAWHHQGAEQRGSLSIDDGHVAFLDSFHSRETMTCRVIGGARGLLQAEGSYGEHGEWGWRIGLFHRAPTQTLVLQMTNVAPWGEEARAVRMTCTRR